MTVDLGSGVGQQGQGVRIVDEVDADLFEDGVGIVSR